MHLAPICIGARKTVTGRKTMTLAPLIRKVKILRNISPSAEGPFRSYLRGSYPRIVSYGSSAYPWFMTIVGLLPLLYFHLLYLATLYLLYLLYLLSYTCSSLYRPTG